MNLKERGITVGDLLIILMIIIISTILIKSFSKDKKTTLNYYSNQEKVSYKKVINKNQILQMVNLVSISNDINDLKDNLKWESSKSFHQNN